MKAIPVRAELVSILCRLAAETVSADPQGVTEETHLFDDLNYDSLDAVEFTMKIEEEFDVTIPDQVSENVRTVGQAVEMLLRLSSAVCRA